MNGCELVMAAEKKIPMKAQERNKKSKLATYTPGFTCCENATM